MTRLRFGLSTALLLSFLAHLLPFVVERLKSSTPTPPTPAAVLQARIAPPPPAPAAPKLSLPPPTRSTADKAPAPAKTLTAAAPSTHPRQEDWQTSIRRQFARQHERGEFYPLEAIARGEQGEVLVLVLIDEQGRVSAARIEQGCGFPLLDQAALQAVRKLHSLPAETPRELVLPVRFRLR